MPNRIIKESIRTSKTINSLSDFQFRLWVYLITYVDDYGRGSADSELLKGFVFPRRKRVSESDIKNALAELAGMGCIILYEVDGESYFYFPNWGEHQRIQTKKSKYPAPDDGILLESTVTHRDSLPESESNPNTNPNPNPKPHTVRWAGLSPRLTEALEGFEEMRKKAKKPMTDKARELALKELFKLSKNEEEQIAIVEQSIAKCWLSFYPLKDKAAGSDTSRLVRMIEGGAFND